jgi:hypothetical protein
MTPAALFNRRLHTRENTTIFQKSLYFGQMLPQISVYPRFGDALFRSSGWDKTWFRTPGRTEERAGIGSVGRITSGSPVRAMEVTRRHLNVLWQEQGAE